jgi:transposase-like protein
MPLLPTTRRCPSSPLPEHPCLNDDHQLHHETRLDFDETYVKVAGRWRYVYRAVDQFGQVIDVFVSPRRDAAAARFFERAIGTTNVTPLEVVTDQAATLWVPENRSWVLSCGFVEKAIGPR